MIEEIEEQKTGCPYHQSVQITSPARRPDNRPIYQDETGAWHVTSYTVARSILRGGGLKQAGFQAEVMEKGNLTRFPILFLEGAEHTMIRKNTAKFFTPKSVKSYDTMIENFVDQMLTELKAAGRADLSDLTMKLASLVAGKIVGLTNSDLDGMIARLNWFFEADTFKPGEKMSLKMIVKILRSQVATFRFYFKDVLPAVRARRKEPQDDLISHLLEQEYSSFEILVECLTFGAAGMVTTREFISVAALHFMRNSELMSDYLAADHPNRHEILHEILRLEPVVGELNRRTVEPIEVDVDGETIHIPAGELVNLHLYEANANADIFGDPTEVVCPHRDLPKTIQSPGMSFGDGPHRCPGAYVAIEETDMFLTRFLRLDGLRVDQDPTITRNDVANGYEFRNFMVAVD